MLAALSRMNVARALADQAEPVTLPLPAGACAARDVPPHHHRLVRRAFQLSRSLPDELLRAFEKQTSLSPRPISTPIQRTTRLRPPMTCRHNSAAKPRWYRAGLLAPSNSSL